jgi:hypothetical protein
MDFIVRLLIVQIVEVLIELNIPRFHQLFKIDIRKKNQKTKKLIVEINIKNKIK